ncbi:MAG: zinc-ribbon domain-containing protein [Alphaproteobacteria bacterium]
MRITCPNCEARFSIADHLMGPTGRKLRCTSCGLVWHQAPGDGEDATPAAPPAKAAPRPAAAKPAAKPAAAPAREPPPPRARDAAPMPLEMEPSSQAAAEAAADVAVRNVLAREFPMEDDEPERTERAERDDRRRDEEPPRSRRGGRGGLDESFSLATSLLSTASNGDDGPPDIERILADDDPDPIPEVFSGPKPQTSGSGKSHRLLWVVLVLLVLLGGAAGGAWYKRDMILERWPEVAGVMEMLHLPVASPTSMLQVKDIVADRFAKNGVDILVVKGIITNTSDQPRPVPKLRLGLYDAANALIQETDGQALNATLPPGESTRFTIQLEHPAQAAHHFEIGYVTP